jgi:tetratricopeptide (TPR) repeat protein
MKALIPRLGLVMGLMACDAFAHSLRCAQHSTTDSAIAIANLDDQIARVAGSTASIELLLARSRFLGDYDALGQAIGLAEHHPGSGEDWLRAAQAHAAEHRFALALEDLAAAERAGMHPARIEAARASILVASGHADAAIGWLEAQASSHPGYAAYSSLAIAYAELGRYARADALYARALADLDTTSPFPYAWLHFARGVMWAEQAGDPDRGARFYALALSCVPQFAAANIHMAEIDVARGDLPTAAQRLKQVLGRSPEPEAMALLGVIQIRMGHRAQGEALIEEAQARYTSLLHRHPLAFADHAAEFYLGPGNHAERAWQLAWQNLGNRETRRAFALAIEAAHRSGHSVQADELLKRARKRFGKGCRSAAGAPGALRHFLHPCRAGPAHDSMDGGGRAASGTAAERYPTSGYPLPQAQRNPVLFAGAHPENPLFIQRPLSTETLVVLARSARASRTNDFALNAVGHRLPASFEH